MEWNLMTVRSAEDTDGRMYPLIGSGDSVAELEPADGNVKLFKGGGLVLCESIEQGGATEIAFLKDVPVQIMVTDSRVVLSADKWNKGSRYWGVGLGATSALIDNIALSIREARQRRGSLLMGHIRYNWMHTVGCQRQKNWGLGELLRLVCVDGYSSKRRLLIMSVALAKSESSASVADLIAARTAAYWLARDDADLAAVQPKFEALRARQHPLVATKGKVNSHSIPLFQKAHEVNVRGADIN